MAEKASTIGVSSTGIGWRCRNERKKRRGRPRIRREPLFKDRLVLCLILKLSICREKSRGRLVVRGFERC